MCVCVCVCEGRSKSSKPHPERRAYQFLLQHTTKFKSVTIATVIIQLSKYI